MATSMVLGAIRAKPWTRQQEGVLDLKALSPYGWGISVSIRFSERLAEQASNR
ncbi:hypothetical protein ABOD65_13595 [Mycobacterium tuberculosis]